MSSRLATWLALFVLSGVGGLVFQVIWTRKLALVLGSTVQSASLTSAAFMLGLGLGAALAGSAAEKSRNPLRSFAALELGIATLGLGVTWSISRLPFLFGSLLGSESALYRPLLLATSMTLLVIPALLMGATLPLLVSAHVRRSGAFARTLAFFYAANTLGASVGAFATDFLFVKLFGVWGTACLAAGFDAAVALIAYGVSRRWSPLSDPSEGEASPTARPAEEGEPARHPAKATRMPLAYLAFSGFCGLGLEIAWTRLLVFFNGTDIYAYSLVLSVYLLGIVLGSLLVGWLPRRWIRPEVLGVLFLCLGLLAWQSVYTLGSVGSLVGMLADSRFWRRVLACLILILPSTLILGAIFPIASDLVYQAGPGKAGHSVGRAYIWNTLGSVLGALVAGFGLLTHYGLQATVQGFGSVALLAATLALSCTFARGPRAALVSVSAVALAAATLIVPNSLVPFIYDRNGDHLIFWADDHYGAVALVDQTDPSEQWRSPNLLVDGYNMAGNNLESRRYTAQLAILPALLNREPENVLMVCLGVGNTLRALESLPTVKHIDVVELSSTVVKAVRHIPEVKQALESPKVELTLGDGRYYLATTSRLYDVITAEPPPPTQAGIVNLYSREYYTLCARRLRPDGVVAQWLPVMQMSQFEAKTIIRAFQDVFPYAYLYQGSRLQLVLVGSTRPLDPQVDRAQQAFPVKNERLASVDLDEAEKVFATYLAGPEKLRAYTQGIPPLTDDRPYLQYHDSDWTPDLPFLLAASLAEQRLTWSSDPAAAQQQQQRYSKARQRVLWRNLYHWQNTGDPWLDRILRLQYSRDLMKSASNDYDRVVFGATARHREALLERPADWQRAIDLARWEFVQLEPSEKELRRALDEAARLASSPLESGYVSACKLLMLGSALTPEQRAVLERDVRQSGLSPRFLQQLSIRG